MIHGIWIHGKPVPKGRPRFARNGGVYTPKTTADYEKRIADAWREKYGDKQVEPRNLAMHVDVYTKRYSTSDVDNFLKIAMDGLQGVAFENDSCIKTRALKPMPACAFGAPFTMLAAKKTSCRATNATNLICWKK
jgi:crossover junction endodeoxyribonuclease RusA